jgi:hypothetical protein
VAKDEDWNFKNTSIPFSKSAVCPPEPLILEYNLTEWMNDAYKGGDATIRCTPALPSSLSSAFVRKGAVFTYKDEDTEEDVPFRDEEAGADVPGTAPSDDEEG